MAANITLATASQSVRTIGPLVSASALKQNPAGWSIVLFNGADWPTNGQDVLTILLKQAPQLNNFQQDFSITLSGHVWTARGNATPVNTTTITVKGGWSDNILTRMAQLTVTILQPCTFGCTVTAL